MRPQPGPYLSPFHLAVVLCPRFTSLSLSLSQYDFGFEGLNRSLETLDAIGIPYSGLGRSSDAVRVPKVVRRTLPRGGVGGGTVDVDVAFFTLVIDECWVWPNGTLYLDGCTCGASANPKQTPPYQCYEANATMPGLWYNFGIDDALITELSTVIAAYKAANPKDLVVTYLHVGPNFQWQPYPVHEQLLRNASAAGADLVWGTSSHHVQRFEVFDGKPIVYGLGDLLFRHVVGVEDWCPVRASAPTGTPCRPPPMTPIGTPMHVMLWRSVGRRRVASDDPGTCMRTVVYPIMARACHSVSPPPHPQPPPRS